MTSISTATAIVTTTSTITTTITMMIIVSTPPTETQVMHQCHCDNFTQCCT